MTVRRAVPLQGTAQDPGAALAPGGGGRGGTGAASAAPIPSAAPDTSATAAPSASASAVPPNPVSEPVRTEGETSGGGKTESSEAEPTAGEGEVPAAREGEAPARSTAAHTGTDPDAADIAPGADIAAVLAGAGSEGGGAATVAASHGGPKKPMLAAAAIVGALLIGVPFLVAGQGDKDERSSDRTDNAAGTVLDSDRIPHASQSYATEAPSPSASTSPSPSESPEEKRSKDPGRAPVAEPKQAAPTVTESKKTESKKATTLSAAEKLRRQANAASSARTVLVRNSTTGLCADVPDYGNGKIDGPVNQYPCNGTAGDNQLWNLEVVEATGGPEGASLFLIRNSKDKYCMDLPYYGSAATGTNVTEYYCRATADNQLWWLDPRSDGSYWIRSYSSNNLCLGLEGGASAGNDAHLEIGGCGSADRWTI
ncbi:MAG: ricin-type beta-trefoil lectin domain protein [Streptomyces sp.]|nr:ricin-type beta-trefoil lectin domain protein [Streptomyces sp.]